MAVYAERFRRHTTHHRPWWWRLRGLFAAVAVLGLLGWAGEVWLGRKVESSLRQALEERGLNLDYGLKTWDPWRGLELHDVKLTNASGHPVAELDNVAVSFPLSSVLGGGEKLTWWRVRGADLTLYDEAGPVKLDDMSLDLEARPGDLKIGSLHARHAGLDASLSGDIFVATAASARSSEPFRLRLAALRGTLEALDVAREPGLLKVSGNFSIDARQPELIPWRANLAAEAGQVVWQGIPLQSAKLEAVLSESASELSGTLQAPHGHASFKISRQDWRNSPFGFSGSYTDLPGRTDDFEGSYTAGTRRLVMEKLRGDADLQAAIQDLPALAGKGLPQQVEFSRFPLVDLRNLVREGRGDSARWSVEEVKLDGAAIVRTRKGEIQVTDIAGGLSYQNGVWTLKDLHGGVFGGTVNVSGSYQNGLLAKSHIEVDDLKLAQLKEWINAERTGGRGILFGQFRGSVELSSQRIEGRGSMHLENAPVFDAPLLEQTYEIFDALFPGIQRAKAGEFDADFTAKSQVIEVDRFEAKGGTLTVNAKGTINLDTKRVNGTARGKLTGVKGVVTSPLSRLLEMEVGGPFDDIRVRPLGPAKLASNAADATVGAAADTGKEALKITGTVLKEGAKLPFRIFGGKGRQEQDSDESSN